MDASPMKLLQFIGLLSLVLTTCDGAGTTTTLELRMPGVQPTEDDQYLCSGIEIPDTFHTQWFITGFDPLANMSIAHHMLLYGCEYPMNNRAYYPCNGKVCGRGGEAIVYAWARQAPPLTLPNGVGFAVGKGTKIQHLVVQIHYLKPLNYRDTSGLVIKITQQPQPALAGVYLMYSGDGVIPGLRAKVPIDISCQYTSNLVAHPFAFRTHAHALGRTVLAYVVSQGESRGSSPTVQLLGRGNPQWPQAFYPIERTETGALPVIRRNDYLLARCIYDSRGRERTTVMGMTHMDEMCNFYIMYYVNQTSSSPGGACGGNSYSQLWQLAPSESMDYAPDRAPVIAPQSAAAAVVQPEWKVQQQLGQVGGVAIRRASAGSEPELLVFHRSNRIWSGSTFDFHNRLSQEYSSSPISDPVVLHVRPSNGTVLTRWGQGLFYLPHGIAVAPDGAAVWLTDVGLHQVMKFTWGRWDRPSLVLGEKLVPGNDAGHFCKPADVAVAAKGDIYIADGYCNSRVMRFSSEGRFLASWGSRGLPPSGDDPEFSVVHSVALVPPGWGQGQEEGGQVCVADREHAAVLCFNLEGKRLGRYAETKMLPSVYAIAWHPQLSALMGVTGDNDPSVPPHLFTLALQKKKQRRRAGKAASEWGGGQLSRPHDLAVSDDGNEVFVAEIGPNRVVKIRLNGFPAATSNGVRQPHGDKEPGLGTRGSNGEIDNTPASDSRASPSITGQEHTNVAVPFPAPAVSALPFGRSVLSLGVAAAIASVLVLFILGLLGIQMVRARRRTSPVTGVSIAARRRGDRSGFQPIKQQEEEEEEDIDDVERSLTSGKQKRKGRI